MTNYQSLTYLDHAATAPMPDEVLQVINEYYQSQKVNVHRGMYRLAHEVTESYEQVRTEVVEYLNAQHRSEIIFTSGATEALNLVAFGYGRTHLQVDDEIITTVMEHHSNLVPWQQVAKETGAKLTVVGLNADGEFDVDKLVDSINDKTKIVAVSMLSNVLGQAIDIQKVTEVAHQNGAVVVVDAAQAVAHKVIDVQKIDADFVAFSGHKIYGPTGVGVLYGRQGLLEQVTPMKYGGEMIDEVTLQSDTFQPLPLRLEAGTPNVAGVLGLGAALRYLKQYGYENIQAREQALMTKTLQGLSTIKDIKIYGPQSATSRRGVISFNVGEIHAHDVATILDANNIAVRAGHLCAEPLMQALGVESVVRVSLSFLNNEDDIEKFLSGMRQVEELLG